MIRTTRLSMKGSQMIRRVRCAVYLEHITIKTPLPVAIAILVPVPAESARLLFKFGPTASFNLYNATASKSLHPPAPLARGALH